MKYKALYLNKGFSLRPEEMLIDLREPRAEPAHLQTAQCVHAHACVYMCVCVQMCVQEWERQRQIEKGTERRSRSQGAPHSLNSLRTLAWFCHLASWELPCHQKTISPKNHSRWRESDRRCGPGDRDSPTSEVRVRRVLLEDIHPWQALI